MNEKGARHEVGLTSFVGRGQDLAEGRRLLGGARLVTLVGPGGVGKTRLARRLADDVARAFSDGAFVVELAELRDPDALTTELATTLDLEDVSQIDGSGRDGVRPRAQAAAGPRQLRAPGRCVRHGSSRPCSRSLPDCVSSLPAVNRSVLRASS